MMKIEFLESAQYELDDAVEYYNQQKSGLGIEFLSEIIDSLNRISEYPDAWQELTKRTRRCLIHRFPYGIIYQNRNDMILIVAVANLHRKPTYWHDRTSG
jgi:toxin ParE2